MVHTELINIRNEYQKNLEHLAPISMRILSFQIRIKKIDLIFNPEFNLISSPNKKSGKTYLQAKVYWPNKDGKIIRSLSFSLGNIINYPNGIKHEITISKAKKEIQEILMKKFGNLI